jgi:gliding motility-associated-like protein
MTPPIIPLRYPPINATAGIPVELDARTFTLDDHYLWSPAVGLNEYAIRNPTFNFNNTVEYKINISTGTGCTVVDTLLVKVIPPIEPTTSSNILVPKAWSPNGDGHNDKLIPLLYNMIKINYFRVFNRWGQLVYETNIPGNGWDGLFNGVPQGTDVFTWIAEGVGSDGRIYNKQGTSVLLR